MYYYAISDPHGCLDVFDRALETLDLSDANQLFLLGDYVPHETVSMGEDEYLRRCAESLSFVWRFESEHAGHVTVLLGNHELFLLERWDFGQIEIAGPLGSWLRGKEKAPFFAETERRVFVHAGVCEEAEGLWRYASDNWYLCGKYPPSFGAFEKDVVAGHVSAGGLAHDVDFEGVFWDGASHYYIDGTTERTGRVNILRYDTERDTYDQRIVTVGDAGEWREIRLCARGA